MRKPNLFIVGAARSGTTALWQILKNESEIFMPENKMFKEPAFFSQLKKSSFKTLEDYLKIFCNARENQRWIGEASSAYLTDPESAKNIFDFNPEARIIVILRNPVHRAYSLYNWMSQQGYEYAETFEEALQLEKERVLRKIPNYFEPEYYHNYLYYHSGLYYQQLKRYIDLFKNNLLILKFENLKDHFKREWEKVCKLLDIHPNHGRSLDIDKNESNMVTSPLIQFLLRKTTKFYLNNKLSIDDDIKNTGGRGIKKRFLVQVHQDIKKLSEKKKIDLAVKFRMEIIVRKIVTRLITNRIKLNSNSIEARDGLIKMGVRNRKPNKIKNNTRMKLQQKYLEDIKTLSVLTGIDFSNWQN